ncbi:hypothetical protein PoB_001634400 [Plakobranchus ocellatus]|uniref:Uncharacterized protein n=1 Tax=Plakobranchus ocellatus TaxID=259542 RepID=A0AAV3Z618_9GAST|nr:hypothetical protein PoB_001634400 [Plakobranchus ocellatus]
MINSPSPICRSEKPYFTVQFDGHEISSQVREEFQRRYPKMGTPGADSEDKAKASVYLTEMAHSYTPNFIYPRITAPVTLEKQADPVRNRRPKNPPFEQMLPERPCPYNDPDRGFHVWRGFLYYTHNAIWQPYVRHDWTREVSERNTLPQVRGGSGRGVHPSPGDVDYVLF